VLRVFAANYRINPGLQKSIGDIMKFLDINDEELLNYLNTLEIRGLVSRFANKKGEIELAKATWAGIREANPLDHYKQIPSRVSLEDRF